MSAELLEMDRQITRALELGKGTKIAIASLDILVSSGVVDALKAAAAKALTARAQERQDSRARANETEPVDTAAQAIVARCAGLIIDLDRRLTRKIERGKAMILSDEDMDILVITGAVSALKSASANALGALAESRQQARNCYRDELVDARARGQHEAVRQLHALFVETSRVPRPKLDD